MTVLCLKVWRYNWKQKEIKCKEFCKKKMRKTEFQGMQRILLNNFVKKMFLKHTHHIFWFVFFTAFYINSSVSYRNLFSFLKLDSQLFFSWNPPLLGQVKSFCKPDSFNIDIQHQLFDSKKMLWVPKTHIQI